MGGEPDMIFHCRTCGTRIYGPEKVKGLVAAHAAAVQAAAEREQKRLEEDRRWLREKEEQELAEKKAKEAERKKALRAAAMEKEILAAAKCAWPPCPNDHTMTSKYCSRVCSNKNAHARAKSKKAVAV
jgi:hypothetical protein